MKRLAAVCVVLVVLGISAQANAFVLVYNLFGFVQAVDTAASDREVKLVNGYIVMNVNEADGTVDESSVVLYGREGWLNRIYTVSDDALVLATYGNFVTLVINPSAGNKIVMTGRLRARSIGLPQREDAAPMLDGAMALEQGQLFNLDESLVGAGAMQAMLNLMQTRNANASANGVDEVVGSILGNLAARGFQELVTEEDPPVPDDGDEEPPIIPQ